jgi:peptidoglycan/LPS O-acetylase OafA/YrhL
VSLRRFRGIEGLRAWLAWSVVAVHVVGLSGLCTVIPPLEIFMSVGQWSVEVFIIISGFVIANLILSEEESYPIYIARRFLRLYPAYVVCLLLDMIFTRWGYVAFLAHPWGPHMNATPGMSRMPTSIWPSYRTSRARTILGTSPSIYFCCKA